ncbi:MAG: hypothetical protein HZA53_10195 [Planctomycetes bacterium]|nr:hypothetical protein [Planctomycetota bacterium]
MKRALLFAGFLLLALALGSARPILGAHAAPSTQDAPRALVFAPKQGARLARTVAITHVLDVASIATGPATGGELRRAPADLRIETKLSLALEDELLALGSGRVERLRRRFGTGSFHAELGPKAPGTPGAAARKAVYAVATPLVGMSVVSTWVPEEQGYGRYYDEGEALEEFLESLREDVDLRALLPAAPVSTGAAWTIPAKELADVFAPCGRLPWAWPKDLDRVMARSFSTGIGGGLGELFGGSVAGEAKAKLARFETRDGEELAIVALELDLHLEREQGEVAPDPGALDENAQAPSAMATRTQWAFRGTGELVWSLGAARAKSLRIDGDQKIGASVRLGATRQELELAGTLALEYGVR